MNAKWKYTGIAVVLVLAVLSGFASMAGRGESQLHSGDSIPITQVVNIQGQTIDLSKSPGGWVHLQFRRYAGCPICNLHLQSFVKRHAELKKSGIREVVVFHSPKESLIPYHGQLPFDVIGDPEKNLYRQFGVQSSVFSILNPFAWASMIEGNKVPGRPRSAIENGALGLPADFLIGPDGKIVASHYGRHSYDQWSVDEILAFTHR